MNINSSFIEIIGQYEKHVETVLGEFKTNPRASQNDINRAEKYYNRILPDDLKTLYKRYNGTEGSVYPECGFMRALPTSSEEAFSSSHYTYGAPFGVRDHITVFVFDPYAFTVVLDPKYYGEVWLYVEAEESNDLIRVAPNLFKLFSDWNYFFSEGVFECSHAGCFAAGFTLDEPFNLVWPYWPDINPLIAVHSAPSEYRETFYIPLQQKCSVNPLLVDENYDSMGLFLAAMEESERLTRELAKI